MFPLFKPTFIINTQGITILVLPSSHTRQRKPVHTNFCCLGSYVLHVWASMSP